MNQAFRPVTFQYLSEFLNSFKKRSYFFLDRSQISFLSPFIFVGFLNGFEIALPLIVFVAVTKRRGTDSQISSLSMI